MMLWTVAYIAKMIFDHPAFISLKIQEGSVGILPPFANKHYFGNNSDVFLTTIANTSIFQIKAN